MNIRAFLFLAAGAAAGCAEPVTTDPGSDVSEDREMSRLEQGLDTADIAGNLRVYLTDAPAEYESVFVTVGRVEANVDDAWTTLVDQPQTVDLLTLRDDVTGVLGDSELAPGAYAQLRLIVDEASVVADGVTTPLTIPSGAQTGVKIDLDFVVEPDTVYAVVLDFDAAASIHETGQGQLKMVPALAVEYIGIVEDDGTLTPVYEAEPQPDPETPDGGVN